MVIMKRVLFVAVAIGVIVLGVYYPIVWWIIGIAVVLMVVVGTGAWVYKE